MQIKATIPIQFQFLLIVALCLSGKVQGQEVQEKIQTDRPDQTESPSPVPKRTVQVELGYQFQKNITEGFEAKTYAYPAALLLVGALNWLELRLHGALKDSLIENGSRRKVTGYGPLSVGTKLKLWEEQGWRPELPRNNLQLNVAAGTQLNEAAPDYFPKAGLAVRLPR